MWHDNPFNERNKATERTVGVGFGGYRYVGGGEGWPKFEKKCGR